jgi:predicted permease
VRAALGASRAALRRTLLAEALVLCGAGAVLGVLVARPMVTLVSRFAARFSVRALDVTVDASLLWVGATLAIGAAILLAFVPRLPSSASPSRFGLASGSVRITPATNRRLRAFAVTQIAFSFVLLAGAGTLLAALIALQTAPTGYNMRDVLAINLPSPSPTGGAEQMALYREISRTVGQLPRVQGVALGSFVPWRDAGTFGAGVTFTVEGYTAADGEDSPRARFRIVEPGFFEVVGVPLLAGRDFNADDRRDSESVVIVSQNVAQRLFPDGDALNRMMWWTDPYFGSTVQPRRIVGIVADVDDENIVRAPAMTVYHPVAQIGVAGRLFVRAAEDPYALVPAITKVIRQLSAEQPVERAATLEDVRAEVLAPERVNAFVFSGFAAVALLIAVVGVAGVLAFGVNARAREFGVRLAIGLAPRHLLFRVLGEGFSIIAIGVMAGGVGGYAFARIAANYLEPIQTPGATPLLGAMVVLVIAALLASLLPAARAARVDVLQALRSE